jgi:uncharacterized protein (TIGR03085 family)
MDPVQQQRRTLCDLLDSLSDAQWRAQTMCEGWDAGDICAHMLVREREPWASAGLVIPPLSFLHESRMATRKQVGRAKLIDQLRSGPPALVAMGPIGRVQVSEDYIHTEDVRRGGATAVEGVELTPDDGSGDPRTAGILWQAISRFALQAFGGIRADGAVSLTDGSRTRSFRTGGRFGRRATQPDPDSTVTVTGPVGELLLFTTGRTESRVDVDGPPAMVSALQASGRGV